jgi:hypothetical protein
MYLCPVDSCIFSEAFSSSGYIESNVRMISE